MTERRIRLGMVGGGQGGFIGAVHRLAARLDDCFYLVAGAFSSNAARSVDSGRDLGIGEARSYGDYLTMAKAEAARSDGIEAVAIVTPNHLHAPVATAFLENGIHVICDKPMAINLQEARALAETVEKSGRIFALTHNYSAYPMVLQARNTIAEGAIGAVRLVHVEYLQDWLTEALELDGQKQASWRTDPARSGEGGAVTDIGTHAYQLLRYVTGLKPSSLSADLGSLVPGRKLDDNAHVLLRFPNGARGLLVASQVAPGNENALRLRVYGTKGGVDWQQEDPNHLVLSQLGQPKQLITRGGPGSSQSVRAGLRVPPGHPEGFIEAFANIYSEVAAAIRDWQPRGSEARFHFPGVADGIEGLVFVEAALRSSRRSGAWVDMSQV